MSNTNVGDIAAMGLVLVGGLSFGKMIQKAGVDLDIKPRKHRTTSKRCTRRARPVLRGYI